jgi:hypothetical protein
MRLYLIGGEQKRRFVVGDDDERRFKTAIIVRLDTDSGVATVETEYQSPLSVKCHPDSSNTFGSSTLDHSILYTCTPTEVLLFIAEGSSDRIRFFAVLHRPSSCPADFRWNSLAR